MFPKDAPGILNGAQDRVLVGAIHSQRNSEEASVQTGKRRIRSSGTLPQVRGGTVVKNAG
jgi:hypothetical protein